MLVVMMIVLGFMVFPSEEVVDFRMNSSGTGEYAFVDSVKCSTGLRQSGYSYAPTKNVFIKEVSEDGAVEEPVCEGDVK